MNNTNNILDEGLQKGKKSDLNNVLIEGVLTEDAKIRHVPKTGRAACTFMIMSRRYHMEDNNLTCEVSHIDIEAWDKVAENAKGKALKGRGVRVVGMLKEAGQTGADGKPVSRLGIVAEHIEYRPVFNKGTRKTK